MDPTISNFVRMISGVRQRPLISPHILNSVWSFGGLLKIADSTHAMDVPSLPPHADFVVLDITQGDTLLERWWIGSEGSETYRGMTTTSKRTSPNRNDDDKEDDDVSSTSSENSSTVAIRSSDIVPAVSFGSLKIIVRCVYAYLIASDTGIRSLNIRSADSRNVIIGPDTPLVVRVSSKKADIIGRPTSVATHTRAERPFCCDWRCDTGSPDLGTIIVSVRRTFTPLIATPPQKSPSSLPSLQQLHDSRSSSQQSSSQQQQHHSDPEKLVTPSLRGSSPNDGFGAKLTPPLAAVPTRSRSGGDDDELPPMTLPSAVNSEQRLGGGGGGQHQQSLPNRTLSGLGAPVMSNDSALSLSPPGHETSHVRLPPPKLTPLLAATAHPGFPSADSRGQTVPPSSGADATSPTMSRQMSSSDGTAIPTPTPEQQQIQRLMGTPQRSGIIDNNNNNNDDDDDPTAQQQYQQHYLGQEGGSSPPPPHHAASERITDDNFGCAISTTSVFHSTSWSWELSSGFSLLRPDPPQSSSREHRQVMPGTLGRRSCFEAGGGESSADDGDVISGGAEDENAVIDLLQSLDDLEFVRAHCESRRAMQEYQAAKKSPAALGGGPMQKGQKVQLSANESIEAVVDQLNAAQDNLLRSAHVAHALDTLQVDIDDQTKKVFIWRRDKQLRHSVCFSGLSAGTEQALCRIAGVYSSIVSNSPKKLSLLSPASSGGLVIGKLDCPAFALDFSQCSATWSTSGCSDSNELGLDCFANTSTTTLPLLLAYVPVTRSVLIRNKPDHKWRQLSFAGSDNATATALCAMLGLDTSSAFSPTLLLRAGPGLFDPRSGATAQLVSLDCPSNATTLGTASSPRCTMTTLSAAPSSETAISTSTSTSTAELLCHPGALVSGAYRFRFRFHSEDDALQVRPLNVNSSSHDGSGWGYVCNSASSLQTATALARLLGFWRVVSFSGVKKSGAVFFIDKLSCGSAVVDSLSSCTYDGHFGATDNNRCASNEALVLRATHDGVRSGGFLFKLGDSVFATKGVVQVKPVDRVTSTAYGGVCSSSSSLSSSNVTAAYLCSRVFGFSTRGAHLFYSTASSSSESSTAFVGTVSLTAAALWNVSCPLVADDVRFNTVNDTFTRECSWSSSTNTECRRRRSFLHLSCEPFPGSFATGFAFQIQPQSNLLLVRSVTPLAGGSFGNFAQVSSNNFAAPPNVICRQIFGVPGRAVATPAPAQPDRICVFRNLRCTATARWDDCTYDQKQPGKMTTLDQLSASSCSTVMALRCGVSPSNGSPNMRTTLTVILVVFFVSICILVLFTGFFGARVATLRQRQRRLFEENDDDDADLALVASISLFAHRAVVAPAAGQLVVSQPDDDDGAVAEDAVVMGGPVLQLSPSTPPVGYISPTRPPPPPAPLSDDDEIVPGSLNPLAPL